MAIVTHATDGTKGSNFNRPEKKPGPKDPNVAKAPGVTITALSLPPLRGGRPSVVELPAGTMAKEAGARASAAPITDIDDNLPTPISATGGSASESLSNESSVGHSKQATIEGPVEDDWEAPVELYDFIKEGRGPGRPKGTLWNSDGYPPVMLDRLLIEHFGHQWLIWEPETLRVEIIDDFHTTLSDRVFEKIMALRVCHSTQAPWREWDIFQNVCLAFNDIPVDFDFIQYISPAQVAYTIDQMEQVRKEDYDDDIKAYIATICYEEGYVWLPGHLGMAQGYLDKLNTINEDFKREIQEIWTAIQGKNLTTWPFKEDKLGIQLSRLASIELYKQSKVQTSAQEEDGHE